MDDYSVLTVFMMLYRIRGSILVGIFLVSIISWPRNTAVTLFPHTPAGDDLFDFFKEVVTFRPLKHIGAAMDVCFKPLSCIDLSLISIVFSGRVIGLAVFGMLSSQYVLFFIPA